MNPQAIFFDFDGVILDSARVKTDAMRRLFAHEQPSHVDAIVALHVRHGGVSRYRKFEMIYRDILKRPLSEQEREGLGNRFTDIALDQVMRSPPIDGAEAVLKKYAAGTPLFVISGTPETELRDIVVRRGFERYFTGVFGSPRSKIGILDEVLKERNLNPRQCVFVGDALTDIEAAQSCTMPFVGIVPRDAQSPFGSETVTIPDLLSFDMALTKLGPLELAKGNA